MPDICIDFDGVLHSYHSGWQGAARVADMPTPGAQEFMRALPHAGFNPVIQSARAASGAGQDAILSWLALHGFPDVPVAHGKPFASVYLDDRSLRFNGVFPSIQEIVEASVPWNRR